MIKPFRKALSFRKLFLIAPLLGTLTSCNPTKLTGTGVQSKVTSNNDGKLDNKAYVYLDSPYMFAGPNYGPANVDMGRFLDKQAKFITANTSLTGNCFMYFDQTVPDTLECIKSLEKASGTITPTPRNPDKTYIFPPNSPEFYQTNALYHLTQGTDTFLKKLDQAWNLLQSLNYEYRPKSIPYYLKNTNMFWFKQMASSDRKLFNFDYLTSYSQCEFDSNASFDPTGPSLCFGGISAFPGFYFVQDPSVVYHELGHALVSVMMNARNGTMSGTAVRYHPLRSNLGSYGYDEAASINEGIADYFSYLMNKRERVGEFALGRTVNQARPLTESDDLHITGMSETPEGRLSYPQYLLYDPNNPDALVEDVHYAGQIVTHYLVALTKSLKQECGLDSQPDGGHDQATTYVMLLLAESLAELGDLYARGIDNRRLPITGPNNYFVNMDETNSYFWTQIVNPVTYRRFFQTFSKNIKKYVSSDLCIGFDQNESEKLLDDYGLLLFKTYNDNGNSTKDRSITYSNAVSYSLPTQPPTPVSENNRRKSILVSKQLVELASKTDTAPDRVGFYIIDSMKDMQALLSDLLHKGFTVPLTKGVTGTEYNNNNIKVSPGEVVGIIPNLVNNSNSVMAGVHLLATDWDHVSLDPTTGNFKPCVIDTATTVDQGGESAGTCGTTVTNYKRTIGLKDSSGNFETDVVAPVCFVQLEEGETARWVSQNEFRKKQGLSLLDKDCLGYSSTPSSDQDFTFNPHECLVRFLPGANDAFYSKIDPQLTYYDSVIKASENASFNRGNVLVMEVNKWIPPGTKFRCRLRARFSNCSDCYNDSTNSNDDFLDSDYNGSKPFKVINFDFDVND